MTLDELSTPFERHRVFEYGVDGNKVVRHWYEMQNVIGPLYRGKNIESEYGNVECDLFICFPGAETGLYVERVGHLDCHTVEEMAKSIERTCYDSPLHMVCGFDERMAKDQHIGNAQIAFVRQFDQLAADRFAQYRLERYARIEEQRRQEQLAEQAEEEAERAKQQAELDAAKAGFFGWADDMTPLRFGRINSMMEKMIRVDGKLMTKREFVITQVRDGWMPQKEEGVTSWYKSGYDWKESKPKTVYRLEKGRVAYEISKTEYDFAMHLVEHSEKM